MEALIYQGVFLNYFLDNNTNFQLSSETKKKRRKENTAVETSFHKSLQEGEPALCVFTL